MIYRFEFGVECGLARCQSEGTDRMTWAAIVRKRPSRKTTFKLMTVLKKLRSHSAIRWSDFEPSRWPAHLSRRHNPPVPPHLQAPPPPARLGQSRLTRLDSPAERASPWLALTMISASRIQARSMGSCSPGGMYV